MTVATCLAPRPRAAAGERAPSLAGRCGACADCAGPARVAGGETPAWDAAEEAQMAAWLADALQREVARTERHQAAGARPLEPSPFCGRAAPAITLADYLRRIQRYAKCSPACLLMALDYVQRLAAADAAHRPCALSVHRLALAGVLVACKLTDDRFYSNAYFARIGGVSTRELNALELALLRALGWRAAVSAARLAHLMAALRPAPGLPAKPAHELRCSPAAQPAPAPAPPAAQQTAVVSGSE